MSLSNKLCKKSSLEYVRTFVRCGNLGCAYTCNSNCPICIICLNPFHSRCVKMTKREYAEASKRKKFVCSNKCYNSTLPFFNVDKIDLLSTIFGKNLHPCKKCKQDCVGHRLRPALSLKYKM